MTINLTSTVVFTKNNTQNHTKTQFNRGVARLGRYIGLGVLVSDSALNTTEQFTDHTHRKQWSRRRDARYVYYTRWLMSLLYVPWQYLRAIYAARTLCSTMTRQPAGWYARAMLAKPASTALLNWPHYFRRQTVCINYLVFVVVYHSHYVDNTSRKNVHKSRWIGGHRHSIIILHLLSLRPRYERRVDLNQLRQSLTCSPRSSISAVVAEKARVNSCHTDTF